MRILHSNSLSSKMTVMVLLVSSLATTSLMALFLVLDGVTARRQLQDRLRALADVIGQNSAAALAFDDRPAANEVLGALQAEESVLTACLYASDGTLFARYSSGSARLCPGNAQLAKSEKSSHVLRPVTQKGEAVGSLLLLPNSAELGRRWRGMLLIALLLFLAAMFISSVWGQALQRRISEPVLNLVHAMNVVRAEQSFATRVKVGGSDEIARLGENFNAMLQELERREQENKSFEAKLQFQASNDALTGLPNRGLFGDRLEQSLALMQRQKGVLALLYIDLDGFKLVNDSLGHSLGDALLVEVAVRLQAKVRKSDTLARLGGDEFTVILNDLHHKDEAMLVAKGLLGVLAERFVIREHEIVIGASIGISIFPENGSTGAELLQQADSAMYAAKRNGKNCAMYYTDDLGKQVRERLTLENQLRGALARGEIQVHYQPEFEVLSGRLVRFEALARWKHPTLGMISPDKFIRIAEESGLIFSLGAFIMEEACREAVGWSEVGASSLQIAVNVSTMQFDHDHFVDEVREILERTGLPASRLQLELTESVMISGVQRSVEKMNALRKLGVSLAIDDFGTGYSCLSYLPGLPFDALKIDRSFVREMETRAESRRIVHSLVTRAHSMGMRVIVEGIETPEQLELIRNFGGNEIQGYLMGKPAPDAKAQIAKFRGAGGDAKMRELTLGHTANC